MSAHRYIYDGRVQGVGFRFTTRSVAERFAVTGYVKNLRDGTVELVVAGDDAEVGRFLEAIDRAMAGYIDSRDEAPAPGEETYSGFGIRY